MEILTIQIDKKSEVPTIKKILSALNVKILEEESVPDEDVKKRLEMHFSNYNNSDFKEANYSKVNPDNIWENI